MNRQDFLKLSWDEQKQVDFRKLFDPETTTNLVANCFAHNDDTASLVIYENSAYCFGCKMRWWPDQFLEEMQGRGILVLGTQRGSKPVAAPKYIPLAVADTYKRWLWASDGPYRDRRQFLLDRGLTDRTCVENLIGHTGEAFSIPVFHTPEWGGSVEVQSIRYRRDDGVASEDRPKYWGTGGANQSLLYVPLYSIADKTKYGVILCEGELDALRLCQEGYPAVSLTNGCNALKPEHLPKLAKMARKLNNRVTVCYDMDDPGRNAAQHAVNLLESQGIKTHCLSWHVRFGKDVTEYLAAAAKDVFFLQPPTTALESKLADLWRYDS